MADADADDLYSDLYGDEIQLTNSPPREDSKSGIKQEEKESSTNNAAVSSFIPGGAAYQPPTQNNNNQNSNSRFTNQSYNRSSGNQPQSSSSSFIPNQSSSSSSSSSSAFIPSNNDYSDSNNRNQRERRQYGSNAPNALFNQGNKFGFSNSSSSVGGANDARDRAPHQREQKEIPNESIGKLRPHEMPDDGKIFVGGLDWSTTDESLKGYFEHFGKVSHVTIMRDPSGKSRGFAFLCFADKNNVQEVMAREHVLDGKVIDAKRAIPRPEHQKCSKIFVGGVASTVTPDQFREFFTQYGTVTDSTLMMDKETQRTRGFGFVSFAEEDAAEKLIAIQPLEFEGKSMEIKPAAPKHERDQAPAGSTILRRGGGSGGTTSGQTYDSRTGDGQDHRLPKGQSNNNNQNNFNGMNMMGGGMGMNMGMNPMGMMSGDGGNQFDPSMMARMFQQTGWGSQQWNPQMLWQMNNGMMNGMNGMGGMGMNMGMMGGGGYGNNMSMNMGNFGGASSPMGMMGGIGMQSPMNHQMNNQIGGSMSPPPQNQMQQQRQSNQNSSSSSQQQQQQQVNPNGRKRVDYSNLDNYQIKTNDNNNGKNNNNNNNNNNHQNNRSGGMSTLPKAPSTLPPRPNTFIQDRSQSISQQSDTVIDVMSRGRNSSSRSKSPETAKRLAGRDRERSPDSNRRNENGDEEGGGGGRADRY